jgi:outer membrane protein OmpA-like peptidoglycan-associated protein
MKLTFPISRLAVALLVVGLCSAARSADSSGLGRYDFGYFMGGDQRARPVQVFDDGRNTYFQFRAGEAVPAIFAVRDGVPQLVVPAQEGPYVRVPQLHGRFLLQVGRAQANVIHGAGDRPDAPPVSAVARSGMTHPHSAAAPVPAGGRLVASLAPVAMSLDHEPALDRNSYATPVKGDRVYWPERTEEVEHSIGFARAGYVLSREAQRAIAGIAQRSAPAARFTVIGRDDDSYKEGLEQARAEAMRDALVKAGIGSDRITLRTGVMKSGGKGKLWASTLVVETPEPAPQMRPAALAGAAAGAGSLRPNPAAAANIEALVRSGVLDRVQAEALLARSQAAASPARSAAAPAPEIPAGGFTLSTADKTVSGAVRRWAHSLNYELVWDAPAQLDAPIAGEATLRGQNISEAMDHLLRGLKDKGYALEVTIYANRVIRFTPSGSGTPPSATPAAPQNAPARAEAPANAVAQWQMLPADRTVAGTLARWAGDAQWRVVWSAKDQVPVIGNAVVDQPDFRSAAEFVMRQVAAAGYRLRTSTRGDNTLLVSSY